VPVAGVAVAMAVLQVNCHLCVLHILVYLFVYVIARVYMFLSFVSQPGILGDIVNERGCLEAGERWLESNLVTVAGVAVGIAFLQV